ncbi:MAG: hypothetical protein ACNYVW_08990 [Methanosarcinales archaeon]
MFKKKRKPLVEYIFIDIQRLESYTAQIEGIIKYYKVPTWSAALSLKGPTVSANYQKAARKCTHHEMIVHLLNHLKKTKQLDTERISVPSGYGAQFCLETCVARKALLPSDVFADIQGINELALWISCKPEKHFIHQNTIAQVGTLYLIESYFKNDLPFTQGLSGYSAFEYMLNILQNKVAMTVKSKGQRTVKSKGQNADLARRFTLDPFEYLAGLKAQISAPRRIECLYRRRLIMADMKIDRFVTFGYPIFISDKGFMNPSAKGYPQS